MYSKLQPYKFSEIMFPICTLF